MKNVTIRDAKMHLSQLVADAEAGEEIVIMRGGEPVARLVPLNEALPRRRFGALAGQVTITSAFFDPLPDDELASWNAYEPPMALASNEPVFDAFGVTRLW